MASKNSQPPLIIEKHPPDYKGYPFITLLQFKNEHILCVIDNADKNQIDAYVLDKCGACNVDEEFFINIVASWYEKHSLAHPLSVELSKLGLAKDTEMLFKTFPLEFVARVIGPMPSYPMLEIKKIKRRRKKPISSNIPVNKSNVIKIF